MSKVKDGLKEVFFAPFFKDCGKWWQVTWKNNVYYAIRKDSPIAKELCDMIRELHKKL